jgi:hypothetical protein
MLSSINSPVAGIMATWPDANKKPPAIIAWLYGPIGAGALVLTISFMRYLLNYSVVELLI